MGLAEVTPEYVNLLTNNQYTTRTADASEFDQLKNMFSVYLNSDPCFMPDRKFTHGLALLIAHYYTSGPKDGAGGTPGGGASSDTTTGPISQQSVGDVSISYGSSAGQSGSGASMSAWLLWLQTSVYGMQFVTLMKTFKPTPMVL